MTAIGAAAAVVGRLEPVPATFGAVFAVLAFHRTGSPLLTGVVYALSYLPGVAGGPRPRRPRRPAAAAAADGRRRPGGWRWSPGWPYRPGRSGRSARCSSPPSC